MVQGFQTKRANDGVMRMVERAQSHVNTAVERHQAALRNAFPVGAKAAHQQRAHAVANVVVIEHYLGSYECRVQHEDSPGKSIIRMDMRDLQLREFSYKVVGIAPLPPLPDAKDLLAPKPGLRKAS